MLDFAKTPIGKQFLAQVPRIARALEDIAKELKIANDKIESDTESKIEMMEHRIP